MSKNHRNVARRLCAEFIHKSGGEYNIEDQVRYVSENMTEEEKEDTLESTVRLQVQSEDKRRNKPIPAGEDPTKGQIDAFTEDFLEECVVSTDNFGGRKSRGKTDQEDFIHLYMVKSKKANELSNAAQRELLHEHDMAEVFSSNPGIKLKDALKIFMEK